MNTADGYIIYHPTLGFLVDGCAGGTWATDRDSAQCHATEAEARDAIEAARENGMSNREANDCVILVAHADVNA